MCLCGFRMLSFSFRFAQTALASRSLSRGFHLMIGLVMWTANMVCVYYMDRYALSLLVPMALALVFTVGTACRHTPLERFAAEAGVSQG